MCVCVYVCVCVCVCVPPSTRPPPRLSFCSFCVCANPRGLATMADGNDGLYSLCCIATCTPDGMIPSCAGKYVGISHQTNNDTDVGTDREGD